MTASTLGVDREFARRYIETHVGKRQVNKIQHGFPSPRFWTETEVPLQGVIEDRKMLSAMGRDAPINLYVGVPYCLRTSPGKCGYCLFPVEEFVGNSALEAYFEYLKKEAALYKEAMEGQVLGAVYFGGGTSNLYNAPKYIELMELVCDLFPNIAPDADITLEGIPQLFTREKIETIKNAGMNRISMGVQQVNDRLNKLSGRKQTVGHVTQTLEWAREFKLSCNVDLIFGWPQQTVSTMVQDLETLIGWGVYDITHYELNVGGPTDFALNRYHELPSTLSNLEMYRVSRDLLKSHGYEQLTAYNWRKPGDPAARQYEEGVTHRFDNMNTIGLGYAAITFFHDILLEDGRSWSFINWRNLNNYKAALNDNKFPVECGFRHEIEDFQLAMIFRNLFGLQLDRNAYQAAFGVDVYEQFPSVWDALAEWEFIYIAPEKISVVNDGPFYTPMIQALLAEKRYQDLREREASKSKKCQLSSAHRKSTSRELMGHRNSKWTEQRVTALQQEAQLPANIVPDRGLTVQLETTKPRAVFLTGATGFVGVYIVAEILRTTDTDLHCLVRPKRGESGHARIKAQLRTYNLWSDDEHWQTAWNERLHVVEGDVVLPRLGITGKSYEALAREVDFIIHSAAYTHYVLPYVALKATNVLGLHEVIRFAFHGRIKPVHYLSTAAVWPMGAEYTFYEQDSLDHGKLLNFGYNQSKWVAEKCLLQASERGLPMARYRPGEVGGDTLTGHCVTNHFIFAAMKGFLEAGALPLVDSDFDVAPVDYVTKALVHIAFHCNPIGRAYHLTNPRRCHMTKVLEFFRSLGYRFEEIQFEELRDRLIRATDFSDSALFPYQAVLTHIDDRSIQFPNYDCTNTIDALKGSGIVCPPVDEQLLGKYMRYLREIGYIPGPEAIRVKRPMNRS